MRTRTKSDAVGIELDASLGFLSGQLSKRLTARFNDRLAEHGLTTTQWGVLACLWQQDGLSQKEISTRSGIDTATLTEMLKRMAARGLVRRERDPANMRIQRVYLDSADSALRDSIAAMAAEVNETALAGFNAADRTQLTRLVRRAVANLDRSPTEGEI